jgi:serine/threonine-protein kinase
VKRTAEATEDQTPSGGLRVIPAPRGRLVRRSLSTMVGCVVARRYRITDTIGSGGMGSVYEAVDLQTGAQVALKALQPGAYDPIRFKRLRLEAKVMTAVHSEHVCRVHHLGVERGTPFIVMERLHGETLRSRLTEDGPLPVGEAVAIACQLLDALTATHEAGVIHRDVKPSNVFISELSSDEAPIVKLIDFGLAKVIRAHEAPESERATGEELSSAEMVAGTLHFLAPEQLLSVADLDERVDVYAAGVTLFEMLAGHRAFRGTYSEVIHDIVFSEPPRVTASRPDLPQVFDEVLAMAMAKSRDRRFASAQAFKRALLAAWGECDHERPLQSGVCPVISSENEHPTMSERPEQIHPEYTIVDEELPTLRPPPMLAFANASVDLVIPAAPRVAGIRWSNDPEGTE